MRNLTVILARDDRGSPSAEMALLLPILFALIFGSLELGNYFMTEHKVMKAVRDGARYAARRPTTDYPNCVPSDAVIDDTRNVTRTGQVASGGAPRVGGTWTIAVTATCDNSGTYAGIYVPANFPNGTPVVRVTARVPYTSIVGRLGLADLSLTLNAHSEAAVTGV